MEEDLPLEARVHLGIEVSCLDVQGKEVSFVESGVGEEEFDGRWARGWSKGRIEVASPNLAESLADNAAFVPADLTVWCALAREDGLALCWNLTDVLFTLNQSL